MRIPVMNRAARERWELSCRIFREQEGARTEAEWQELREAEDWYNAELAAEMAYERYLEDRGWMDVFEEEDRTGMKVW